MWSSCSSKINPSTYKFVLALRTYVTNCYIEEYLLKGSGRCVLAENFAKMKPIYHKSCQNLKKAAVLLPLCIVNNELSILFTRRSPILSSYGGQVSFPGGKQDDKDSSPEETALREVYEELGILPESIEIFATSNHSIPDRTGKYSVWLVIGYLGHISLQTLTPNPFEVKEVFCVSLTQLLNENLYGYTKFKNKWVLPVYKNNYHNQLSRQFSLRKSARQGPITWASLGVLLVAGGGIMQYVKWLKDEKKKEQEKLQKMSIGKASIGGSFELMDTQGNLVTNKDFFGKWLLIYFGFCHCPDICPDQLEKMTTIIEKIESIQGLPLIQPIYITVDPHRDSPENIKQYLKDFHKRFIGLTGTDDQIKKVCKAYRVYFSAGPKDEDDDYIVDHTIIMYLINPEGNFVEYFGQNRTINEITGAITTIMMQKRQ